MDSPEKQIATDAVSSDVVYELRVYHSYADKLEALMARFRDHTTHFFKKHGMKDIIYWTATDDPLKGRTLIYLLEHKSREAAKESWRVGG